MPMTGATAVCREMPAAAWAIPEPMTISPTRIGYERRQYSEQPATASRTAASHGCCRSSTTTSTRHHAVIAAAIRASNQRVRVKAVMRAT